MDDILRWVSFETLPRYVSNSLEHNSVLCAPVLHKSLSVQLLKMHELRWCCYSVAFCEFQVKLMLVNNHVIIGISSAERTFSIRSCKLRKSLPNLCDQP